MYAKHKINNIVAHAIIVDYLKNMIENFFGKFAIKTLTRVPSVESTREGERS